MAGVAAAAFAVPAMAEATADIDDPLLRSAAEAAPEVINDLRAQQRAEAIAAGEVAGELDDYAPGTVVASCYRGPWRETLWDRPGGVFLDSVVGVGCDYLTAQAIGDRISKDESLVGDPEALSAEVVRVLAASPAGG